MAQGVVHTWGSFDEAGDDLGMETVRWRREEETGREVSFKGGMRASVAAAPKLR